jgi:hypothetical protein
MILAHYGGIDEIGIFLVPVVVAIVVLRWAEKRARKQDGASGEERQAAGGEDLDQRG